MDVVRKNYCFLILAGIKKTQFKLCYRFSTNRQILKLKKIHKQFKNLKFCLILGDLPVGVPIFKDSGPPNKNRWGSI